MMKIRKWCSCFEDDMQSCERINIDFMGIFHGKEPYSKFFENIPVLWELKISKKYLLQLSLE